jgi:hypothetical protein
LKFSQTLTNIGGKIENQLLIDDYSYFSVLFIGSRFNISLNKFIDTVFNYNGIYTDSMNVFFSSKSLSFFSRINLPSSLLRAWSIGSACRTFHLSSHSFSISVSTSRISLELSVSASELRRI